MCLLQKLLWGPWLWNLLLWWPNLWLWLPLSLWIWLLMSQLLLLRTPFHLDAYNIMIHQTWIPHPMSLHCAALSHVQLFATPWTVAHQAPLSTGFSRQEYWSGLPFPSPGDLPDPGIQPTSLASPALVGGFCTTEPPAHKSIHILQEYKQKGNLNALEWWVFERRQMKYGYGNKRG